MLGPIHVQKTINGWQQYYHFFSLERNSGILTYKVEKNLKGSLDSIPSPLPSVKTKIIGCLAPMVFYTKVEKILQGNLDSIPSPSPSVKTQILGRKVCLRCKGKTLLGFVNKLLKTKSFWHHPARFCLKPIIWIFTEGEGFESRLSS